MVGIIKSLYQNYLKSEFRISKSFRVFNRLFTITEEENAFENFMEYISVNKLKGEYLEFGVYQGEGFSRNYSLAQKYKLDWMNFYAFDSFQGLPKVKSDIVETGQYACSVDEFKERMIKKE